MRVIIPISESDLRRLERLRLEVIDAIEADEEEGYEDQACMYEGALLRYRKKYDATSNEYVYSPKRGGFAHLPSLLENHDL